MKLHNECHPKEGNDICHITLEVAWSATHRVVHSKYAWMLAREAHTLWSSSTSRMPSSKDIIRAKWPRAQGASSVPGAKA